jgi:hypothetical protein
VNGISGGIGEVLSSEEGVMSETGNVGASVCVVGGLS